MRIYSAHTRPGRSPKLVREGFSLGAFLFGPLWLFAHRAWIAGCIALAVLIWLLVLTMDLPGPLGPTLLFGYALLLGLLGRDLCRWSLARRGYTEASVIAAPDAEAARGRLLARDSRLIAEAMR